MSKNSFNHIFAKSVNGPPLNLHINTKITTTTPDPAEYGTILSLKLNNQTPSTAKPKVFGITLDPKLTFSQNINITITKAKETLSILKALTSTK